jgi:hypothetical protein
MTDNRKSGIALTAGSLGLIITMAMHPIPTASLPAEQMVHLMRLSGIAHSIAMVSALLLFLGACGLTRSILAADGMAFAALVIFGFACVAVLIATAVSGFIVPGIMELMLRDAPANARQWQIVNAGIFQINQAFSRIYSVAASLAMILWSASALRNGGFGRGVAIYGCIGAPIVVIAIAIGHLRLDVHGMAAVVLVQAVWFILVGSQLRARPTGATSVP